MSSHEQMRGANAFVSEVTACFGVMPSFFCSAAAAPGLIQELWAFAKSAYLNNPLPSLFKERLFVHLCRFCKVRYCVVRHVGFLIGEGRPAGDPSVAPQSIEQALALLRRPFPDEAALERIFARLEIRDGRGPLPLPETAEEADLFDALTIMFLGSHQLPRASSAVRRAVGDRNFELLTAFLAFVRCAHYWTETHPDLAYEPDMVACMARHPELARLLLSAREAEQVSAETGRLRSERALCESERTLRRNQAWLAAQKDAFQAATNGAPLKQSLGILIPAAIEQADGKPRCAFFISNGKGGLDHVVGMSDTYAEQIRGFEISQESLACGLAVAMGEPVITADVFEEPRWQPWIWLAQEHGYRACWSFPIKTASGPPVGSFAMYFEQRREVTQRDLDLAAGLTQAAAILISRHQQAEERARAEVALRESERRFQQFACASSSALWIRDANSLIMEYASNAVASIYGVEPDAFLGGIEHWAASVVPEDRAIALEHIERARQGLSAVHEFRIQRATDRAFRWIRDTDFPLRDDRGRVQRIGGITEDVTEARLAIGHQAVLLAELQHRVRNIMAIVRSIAARTGEGAESVQEYSELMAGRLLALARVQALLTRVPTISVGIKAIVHEEVHAQAQHAGRYVLDGPDIALSAKAAEVLTLVVHELATNALRYGALVTESGKVTVRWASFDKRGGTWLSFDWVEEGASELPAPAADEPRRHGFGSELIEGRIPYELGGKGHVTFAPAGVHCHLEFPVREGGRSMLETGAPRRARVFGGALDMTGEANLSGHRVLVVEDDYYLATDAERALRGAGAEVMGPCPTEQAALAELDEQRPAAVVVDINLGPGPSFELAETLNDQGIPFVFITGYDQDVIPNRFAAVERLEKPVQLRQIVGAISKLVGQAA